MRDPADDQQAERVDHYEAPAVEAREPLNDPLIGQVSGGMLLT